MERQVIHKKYKETVLTSGVMCTTHTGNKIKRAYSLENLLAYQGGQSHKPKNF